MIPTISSNDLSLGKSLLAIIWTFDSIALLILGVRIFTSIKIFRRLFISDMLMIIAGVSLAIFHHRHRSINNSIVICYCQCFYGNSYSQRGFRRFENRLSCRSPTIKYSLNAQIPGCRRRTGNPLLLFRQDLIRRVDAPTGYGTSNHVSFIFLYCPDYPLECHDYDILWCRMFKS